MQKPKPTIYDVYSDRPDTSIANSQPSMTHQSFKDGADINILVKSFHTTGILGDPSLTDRPVYGDFASYPSFQQSMDAKADSYSMFESLSSAVRDHFNNNLNDFLSCVHSDDSSDLEILNDLGLIEHATSPSKKAIMNPSVEPIQM